MLSTGIVPKVLSYTVMPQLLLTVFVISLADFYRQRFFLDWRREWGLHLRASFLRFVKWPYIAFGLVDAITGRKRPFSLTPKVKTAPVKMLMTWPHLVVCALLSTAWLIGIARGETHHPLLMLSVGITLGLSLAAVWTERWESPPPFDGKLREAEWQ